MRIGLTLLIIHLYSISLAAQTSRLVRVRFINPEGLPIATSQIEIQIEGVQKILTRQASFTLQFPWSFEKGELFVQALNYQSQFIPIVFDASQELLDLVFYHRVCRVGFYILLFVWALPHAQIGHLVVFDFS